MIKPGLQRISRLLAKTPLPWPAIHVAGTNGKGSICAYITAMLNVYNNSSYRQKASLPRLRHGRFTSPHLIDRWDCISINGEPIAGKLFRAVEAEVLKRDREERIGASEFEVLTATAFEIFNRAKIDVGVVEVGMGGAEDATNVIGQPVPKELMSAGASEVERRAPIASVISKIGLDHQGFLGNTLKQIAKQKAGIIKPGGLVIDDPSNHPLVKGVIRAEAKSKGAMVYNSAQSIMLLPHKIGFSDCYRCVSDMFVDHGRRATDYGPFQPPKHILNNATLAVQAARAALVELNRFPMHEYEEVGELQDAFDELNEEFLDVLPRVVFPGRQQQISIAALTGRGGPILLDGAHNADSAKVLADAVNHIRRGNESEPVTWVLAASDSKDAEEIFKPLIRPEDNVVLVEFGPVDGMPWVKPTPVDKLKDALMRALEINALPATDMEVHLSGSDVLSALKLATQLAGKPTPHGSLVVAGSLYLVGDVLRLLRDRGYDVYNTISPT